MRILKEETSVPAKENLPISFVTDLMSKGWDEVGYLKEASTAIKETYKDTSKVEDLMQDLMDAYLVFIGQLELYLHDKEDIVATAADEVETTEETADDENVSKITNEKPELPEAEVEIAPIADMTDEPGHITQQGDFEDYTISDEELTARREAEPFDFFVDFDEPDLSQPAASDEELFMQVAPADTKRRLQG